jgi:hypothetical protein
MPTPRRIPAVSFLIFAIAASATLPQLWQSTTTNLTRDLNRWNLVLNIAANALLGAYSYYIEEWGFVAIGVWFSAYWSYLLFLKGQEHNNRQKHQE